MVKTVSLLGLQLLGVEGGEMGCGESAIDVGDRTLGVVIEKLCNG